MLDSLDNTETICAIASGAQSGCRGIVRISGSKSVAIAGKLLQSENPSWLKYKVAFKTDAVVDDIGVHANRTPRRWSGEIDFGSMLGKIPVAAMIWPGNQSYTGQPSVEFHLIGVMPLLEQLVEMVCRQGARIAGPGEFTLRAFLAGRLDLTQAEAVLGVIHARHEESLAVALQQLSGGLSRPLSALREELLMLLSHLEAGLDFADEDIQFITAEELLSQLSVIYQSIKNLRQQISSRSRSEHAYRAVLMGMPNAGKSSLLNALAGTNAAIVSAQAGTTRDFVSVELPLRSGTWKVIDTAGAETLETAHTNKLKNDLPHAQAQDFAAQQINDADLLVLCIDANKDRLEVWEEDWIAHAGQQTRFLLSENANNAGHGSYTSTDLVQPQSGHSWLGRPRLGAAVLVVWTKCDHFRSSRQAMIQSSTSMLSNYSGAAFVGIVCSSATGLGIGNIKEIFEEFATRDASQFAGAVPMTTLRCADSLFRAEESLDRAIELVNVGNGEDLISGELRLALHELGSVAGEVYTDDILDRIFTRFCIGK